MEVSHVDFKSGVTWQAARENAAISEALQALKTIEETNSFHMVPEGIANTQKMARDARLRLESIKKVTQ